MAPSLEHLFLALALTLTAGPVRAAAPAAASSRGACAPRGSSAKRPARAGAWEELTDHAGWKLAGLGLSISLTRQAAAHDTSTSRWARTTRPLGTALSRAGDLAPSLTLAGLTGTLGALALAGPEATRPRHRRALESLVVSQLIVAGVVDLLKVSVARPRPDTGAPSSFPSGHTSSATALALLLWRRYGWEAGLPATLLTMLVGASRIQDGRHYLSDVLAGAIVGGSITYVVDVLYGR